MIILRINKVNSIETRNKYLDLSDQTKFRINEINKIKDYFNSESQEQKAMSKKLSKQIAAFDFIDKTLIVLSTTFGVSIISFANVIGVCVGIASAHFSLSLATETNHKHNKKQKEET